MSSYKTSFITSINNLLVFYLVNSKISFYFCIIEETKKVRIQGGTFLGIFIIFTDGCEIAGYRIQSEFHTIFIFSFDEHKYNYAFRKTCAI